MDIGDELRVYLASSIDCKMYKNPFSSNTIDSTDNRGCKIFDVVIKPKTEVNIDYFVDTIDSFFEERGHQKKELNLCKSFERHVHFYYGGIDSPKFANVTAGPNVVYVSLYDDCKGVFSELFSICK